VPSNTDLMVSVSPPPDLTQLIPAQEPRDPFQGSLYLSSSRMASLLMQR
jgi:hypothetical protein